LGLGNQAGLIALSDKMVLLAICSDCTGADLRKRKTLYLLFSRRAVHWLPQITSALQKLILFIPVMPCD